MANPVISIITPSRNRERYISFAVESVLSQGILEFEHLIMDGASSDSTLWILDRYPHLRIFSEKDRGMYDAINKGIAKSQGDIIGILNSDDIYEPGIFQLIAAEFNEHHDIDIVTGMATYFTDDDTRKKLSVFPAVNDRNFAECVTTGVPIINAWFFRRRVFEKIGLFNQEFNIGADRDFQIRCMLKHITIRSCDIVFYHYRHHQDSMTINSDLAKQELYLYENLRLAEKYADITQENRPLARQFKKWHDIILSNIFIAKMRKRDLRGAKELVFSTLTKKPVWLIFLLTQIPIRFIQYIYRLGNLYISGKTT